MDPRQQSPHPFLHRIRDPVDGEGQAVAHVDRGEHPDRRDPAAAGERTELFLQGPAGVSRIRIRAGSSKGLEKPWVTVGGTVTVSPARSTRVSRPTTTCSRPSCTVKLSVCVL